MSELKELRKEMVKYFDEMVQMPVDTHHHRGYLTGLRTAINMVVQKIEEEEKKLDDYYAKSMLSEL